MLLMNYAKFHTMIIRDDATYSVEAVAQQVNAGREKKADDIWKKRRNELEAKYGSLNHPTAFLERRTFMWVHIRRL